MQLGPPIHLNLTRIIEENVWAQLAFFLADSWQDNSTTSLYSPEAAVQDVDEMPAAQIPDYLLL